MMKIKRSAFGKLKDNREVYLFTLENDNRVSVNITNYGGIITHLFTPDRNGSIDDIVLGFDNLERYLHDHPYFGAIIGRYANRISRGKFSLHGQVYELPLNHGSVHLHGGNEGFDKKLWTAVPEQRQDHVGLKLNYESPHLEEGYPGNLRIEVVYSLNNNNELVIEYNARSDMDTIINLTNHSYFNLNLKEGNILSHKLKMECSGFTPVDELSIPTGEIKEVHGTPFDFGKFKSVKQDFDMLDNGYDHNLVIDKNKDEFKWFAVVLEEKTGRKLEVGTTQPGVQLYTSNYVDNIEGKNGLIYKPQSALCLETQHYPDSPNNPQFPEAILRKEQQYYQKTVYRFGIIE